jgi:ArsR family transcriptional regulator
MEKPMSDTTLDLEALSAEIDQIHNRVCYALREPVRIMMLYVIGRDGRYVNEISELLQLPQSTVSRHLAVLRERGLVETERQGTSIRYTLADERILFILDEMRKLIL